MYTLDMGMSSPLEFKPEPKNVVTVEDALKCSSLDEVCEVIGAVDGKIVTPEGEKTPAEVVKIINDLRAGSRGLEDGVLSPALTDKVRSLYNTDTKRTVLPLGRGSGPAPDAADARY